MYYTTLVDLRPGEKTFFTFSWDAIRSTIGNNKLVGATLSFENQQSSNTMPSSVTVSGYENPLGSWVLPSDYYLSVKPLGSFSPVSQPTWWNGAGDPFAFKPAKLYPIDITGYVTQELAKNPGGAIGFELDAQGSGGVEFKEFNNMIPSSNPTGYNPTHMARRIAK